METTEFNFLIFRETDKRGDRLGEVIVLKNDSVLNTTSIRYNTRDSSIRLNVHSGVLSVYIASRLVHSFPWKYIGYVGNRLCERVSSFIST